jgi:hypothetical protein
MKIKGVFLLWLCILTVSCSVPRYLSSPGESGLNPYGAYISINFQKGKEIFKGELIAVEKDAIIYRDEVTNHLISLPIEKVTSYRLWYARPKRYEWTMSLASILPLIHGWFSMLSVPVHLFGTAFVSAQSYYAFTYNEKQISLDELKMYSRFPAGLPSEFQTQ